MLAGCLGGDTDATTDDALAGGLLGLMLLLTPLACGADPQYGMQSSSGANSTLRSGHPKPLLKPQPQRTAADSEGQFAPFFDNQNQREQLRFPRGQVVDATPPLPSLSKFDQQVLAVCGELGARVSRSEVRRLLEQNPAVVQRTARSVDGAIFAGQQSQQQFFEDLVQIWTRNYGFEHIFVVMSKATRLAGCIMSGVMSSCKTTVWRVAWPITSGVRKCSRGKFIRSVWLHR